MRLPRVLTTTAFVALTAVVSGCDGGESTPAAPSANPPASASGNDDEVSSKGSPPPESTGNAASSAEGAAEQARFEPPDPEDPLALRVHELADELAEAMVAASRMYGGELTQGGQRDYSAVLKPTACYRIVAAGGERVEDIDLALYDSRSAIVRRDDAADPHPVLGIKDPLCPDLAGMYRIRVEMARGRGAFRMRIFRTE